VNAEIDPGTASTPAYRRWSILRLVLLAITVMAIGGFVKIVGINPLIATIEHYGKNSIPQNTLAKLNWAIVLIWFLGCILGVYVIYAVHRITRPIEHFHELVRRIASGDLRSRVKLAPGHELEPFASSFNHMADSLQSVLGSSQLLSRRTSALLDVLVNYDALTKSVQELGGAPMTQAEREAKIAALAAEVSASLTELAQLVGKFKI
jgi:methyl-accepting chemotaxis protein